MRQKISIAGRRIKGFTYVWALAAIAIVAISAQMAVTLTSTELQREREVELLFRGLAYQEAIGRYYRATVPHRYPKRLDELLSDPRFLHKRHLRHLYAEPMGGEWLLVTDSSGGIVGVASSSHGTPYKQTDFPKGLEPFEGAKSYREWVFLYEQKKPNK